MVDIQGVPETETYIEDFGTAADPIAVVCSDSHTYVVKTCRNGRSTINEQLVGRLGAALGAPVAHVYPIMVTPEFLEIEPRARHLSAGLAHGSLWVPNCTDREWYDATDDRANDNRHAYLAVLFGWMCSNDPQVIYRKSAPRLVFSVDHGNFFPGGPHWTPTSLEGAPPPIPDPEIREACRLRDRDFAGIGAQLAAVTDEVVASAVASLPPTCDFPMRDRVAVAHFVSSRRDLLVGHLARLA